MSGSPAESKWSPLSYTFPCVLKMLPGIDVDSPVNSIQKAELVVLLHKVTNKFNTKTGVNTEERKYKR